MANKELVEAGLKLASSIKSGSKYATEFLDRTIYHTVYVTDADGKVLVDGEGNKIVRNQVYYKAGVYVSKQQLEQAERIEKEFKALNDAIRKQDDANGVKWRLRKQDQKTFSLAGVTN